MHATIFNIYAILRRHSCGPDLRALCSMYLTGTYLITLILTGISNPLEWHWSSV